MNARATVHHHLSYFLSGRNTFHTLITVLVCAETISGILHKVDKWGRRDYFFHHGIHCCINKNIQLFRSHSDNIYIILSMKEKLYAILDTDCVSMITNMYYHN